MRESQKTRQKKANRRRAADLEQVSLEWRWKRHVELCRECARLQEALLQVNAKSARHGAVRMRIEIERTGVSMCQRGKRLAPIRILDLLSPGFGTPDLERAAKARLQIQLLGLRAHADSDPERPS
jgi:hypothetical protein